MESALHKLKYTQKNQISGEYLKYMTTWTLMYLKYAFEGKNFHSDMKIHTPTGSRVCKSKYAVLNKYQKPALYYLQKGRIENWGVF